MNASQIHLALNHAPLFFSILGGLVLLIGLIIKNDSIKISSLYFMIAASLFTIPVYLTGEGTEEMVEKLPGVSESLIGKHEEMAKISLVIIIVTGFAALIALLFKKRSSVLKVALIVCIIFSFASFGVMAQTSHLGGQIRHSEISSTAPMTQENGDKENKTATENDKSGDDKD
jgi:uncharacterized membrane protein